MITFHLALIERDFEEAGISTGMERSRRRVQMQKVREIGVEEVMMLKQVHAIL